jgi:zinc protease
MTVTIRPDRSVEENMAVIDAEVKRLQDTLVNADEIASAIKQARALFAYGSENISNQAFWLGYAEMFDTYDWFVQYVERLEQVTAEDIQRIACSYLNPDNRVVGVYLPTGANGSEPKEWVEGEEE